MDNQTNTKTCDSRDASKYIHIREKLDYTFHEQYPKERQQFQDRLIDTMLESVMPGPNSNPSPNPNPSPRLIYTAGAMGAGKSHCLILLSSELELDLNKFLRIDPDRFKEMMPEYQAAKQLDPKTAGTKFHKESAILSEICLEVALERNMNIICDGSMIDHQWYIGEFTRIRSTYPAYNQEGISIIYVQAAWDKVLHRANLRGLVTGRQIDPEKLQFVWERVDEAIKILELYADKVYYVDNNKEGSEGCTLVRVLST